MHVDPEPIYGNSHAGIDIWHMKDGGWRIELGFWIGCGGGENMSYMTRESREQG